MSCLKSAFSVEMLKNPDPDLINFRDIAASLAKMCMYNGNTFIFYSVAQHALLLRDIAVSLEPKNNFLHLQCLLIFAHKTYIGYESESAIMHQIISSKPPENKTPNKILSAIYKKIDIEYYNINHSSVFKALEISHQTAKRDVLSEDKLPDFPIEIPFKNPIKPEPNWQKIENKYLRTLSKSILLAGLTLPNELGCFLDA